MRFRFFIIFCLIVLCATLVSCKVGIPTVSDISDARLITGEKGKTGVEVDIKVNNPNSFAIMVKKLKIELYSGETLMGKAKGNKKLKIMPLSDQYYTVTLDAKMEPLNPLEIALNGLNGNGNFRLKGFGVARVGIFCKRFEFDETERLK